jgi:hypothetical protein
MCVRRTSVKAFLAAAILLLASVLAMIAAESHHRASGRILLGMHAGRPWNGWDIVWTTALTLSASTVVAGFLFLNKND